MTRPSLRAACGTTLTVASILLGGCTLLAEPWRGRKAEPPPAAPEVPQWPDPVATHRFEIDEKVDIVGVLQKTIVGKEDTLSDIARRFDVGYEDMVRANPGVDPWLPGVGREVIVPSQFILPNAPRKGVVINVAAMRLYYFPPRKPDEKQVVYTYPIGIGRVGWATPEGATKVMRKQKDPVWRPPASVRKEHAENDDPLPALVPAGPDNPLGNRAMYLGWPSYLIHGTNKPYGVGLRSSHGCIRLYPEDIEKLFEDVPVGMSVQVVNQPFTFGWQGSALYLQAYDILEDDPRDWKKAQKKLLSRSLAQRIQQELKSQARTVDWEAIAQLSHDPRGIPVPVSSPGVTLDTVLAAVGIVANRVPADSNWDGLTDLPVDEETFREMMSDSDPEVSPAPVTQPAAQQKSRT